MTHEALSQPATTRAHRVIHSVATLQ